jgi:hypothetical protein
VRPAERCADPQLSHPRNSPQRPARARIRREISPVSGPEGPENGVRAGRHVTCPARGAEPAQRESRSQTRFAPRRTTTDLHQVTPPAAQHREY